MRIGMAWAALGVATIVGAPATAAVHIESVAADVFASAAVAGTEDSSNPFGFGDESGVEKHAAAAVTTSDGTATTRSDLSFVLSGASAGKAAISEAIDLGGVPLTTPSEGRSYAGVTYNFSIDRASIFSIDYAVRATGQNDFGIPLGGSFVLYDILTGELSAIGFPIDGDTGSQSASLAAGSYSLTLGDYNVNHITNGTSVTFDGDFAFRIVPSGVPEPGSWATMIAGFGVAGSALRRDRRRETRTTAAA